LKISEKYIKNFNNEQVDFIGSGGENVLVSASAGTGKTTTMVQKLIYLIIEEHISIDKIMVVTFTTTAAMEMKQRLYLKLQEFLKEEKDENKVTYLYEQLDKVSNADIGTIDAICKKLINRYFYELSIDPVFSILSGKEQQFALDDAIDNVIKINQKQDNPEFYNLYISYNKKRKENILKEILKKVYEFKCSLIDKEEFEKLSLQTYTTDLKKNVAIDYQIKHYKKMMENLKPILINLLNSSNSLGLEKLTKQLENYLEYFNLFENLNSYTDVHNFLEYKFLSKPSKLPEDFLQIEDEYLDFMEDMKKIKEGIKEDFALEESELKFQFEEISRLLSIIFSVVNQVEIEYKKIKQKLNKLDFNDLERYTLEILKHDNVKEELRNYYKYIFIDEYQDVNLLQEFILTSISNGSNLFMIGDVKQSIYAFRQSTPELFVSKFNLYDTKSNGILINFNKNYRSSNNILQFVNRLCEKLITKQTLGIDYYQSRLESGKEKNLECCVDMNIIATEKESEEENEENIIENDDSNKAEAELVVEAIYDLIKNKKYYKDGKEINYNYGDIAVITRNKGRLAKEIFNRLSSYQIPCVASFKNSLFENYEVKLIIDYLKIISNPFNDFAMAGVLSSYIYNLSTNELAEIKINGEGETFSDKVLNYSLNNELSTKILSFKQDIESFRIQLMNLTVLEVIQNIFEKFDFVNYFKSLPDGAIKESNIFEFLKFVKSLNIDYDLEKLLIEIKNFESGTTDCVVGENENAVKILTIHASKGLEWPGVIFCGLGGKFSVNKDTSNIILNNNFGVGLNFIDNVNRSLKESLVKRVIKNVNKQKEINEEIRLLYVALTRAKSHLKLIGCYKLDRYQINKAKNIYDSKNYFDLIFKSNKKIEDAFFYNKKETFKIGDEESICDVKIRNLKDINVQDSYFDKVPIFQTGKEELIIKLKNYFNFHYKNYNGKNIAIKNSVTSILKEEVNYENVVDGITNFSLAENPSKSLDYMKIGTYYHMLMEKIDYNKSIDFDNLEKIFKETIENNEIEKEYIKFINLNHIFNAIKNVQNHFGLNAKYTSELNFLLYTKHSDLIKGGIDNKIIVQGVIDLIIEVDNKFYIVDFKTNRNVTEEELIKMYQIQLNLYAKALELEKKIKVKGKYLYSFSLNKLIEV